MFSSLLLLLLGNILIAIIPLFLVDMTGYSIFSLTLTRFGNAAILEFLVILVIIYIEKKSITKINDIQNKDIKYHDLLRYYLISYPLSYNYKISNGTRRIYQYIFLGTLLIAICIPTYFLALKTLGVIISTISISAVTLGIITFLNTIKKEESFNFLTLVYIILLVTSIITSSLGKNVEHDVNLSIDGIIALIINIGSWILFIILTGLSDNRPIKGDSLSEFLYSQKTTSSSILNPLLQLFYTHITGLLMLIPISLLFLLFGSESMFFSEVILFYSTSIGNVIKLALDPNLINISILCTFVGYLLIFISASNWPRGSLKHDQWNSILTITEPLIGLYIGFFRWNEHIRIDYMVITTILLVAALIIRYYYESSVKIELYFFIETKRNKSKDVIDFLANYKESGTLYVLTGKWDFVIEFYVRSMNRFNQIYEEIKNYRSIKNINYGIIEKELNLKRGK